MPRSLLRCRPVARALALVLGLGGCAATDCDPTQGGLVQGIRCDASGGFAGRIQARQDEKDALLDRTLQLERETQLVEAEQQQLAADLERKRAEQRRAEAELAAVQGQLRRGRQHNAALQQRAKTLEADIARSKAEVNGLGQVEQQKKARLAALARERQSLDREYDAAIGGR
jgi:chromosome segregation ATPase